MTSGSSVVETGDQLTSSSSVVETGDQVTSSSSVVETGDQLEDYDEPLGCDIASSCLSGDPAATSPASPARCTGIRELFRLGWIFNSCSVKLNRTGKSRPFGNLVPCSRNSSKKVWAHAWSGVILAEGVYSSNLDTRSMASGLVLALKLNS